MQAKKILEKIYGVTFNKVRPNWLKNPETDRNLELDLFNENIIIDGTKYSIACEYSGSQHFIYPNGFHKNEQDFKNQLRRDIYKLEMCNLNDVFLLTIPYYISLDNMEAYILENIPNEMLPHKYRN